MEKALVIFLLLILSTVSFIEAQTIFVVDSKIDWQNTGIGVSAGEKIVIIGKGSFSYGSPPAASSIVGPDGDAFQHDLVEGPFLVPTANNMSLVGKIGVSGTPFNVGTYTLVTAASADTLYLSVNDRVGFFDDNSGSLFAVVIRRTDLPMSPTAVSSESNPLPKQTNLSQNYPNPFNPTTTIRYQIAKQGNVEVSIYDINGRLVQTVQSGMQYPGSYSTVWNGKDESGKTVSSGTYFYEVKSGGTQLVKKMLLVK